MKACPFCAEEIQDAAIVCKHCGRDLPAAKAAIPPPLPPPLPQPAAPAKKRTSPLAWLAVIIGVGMTFLPGLGGLGILILWVGLAFVISGGAVARWGGGLLAASIIGSVGLALGGAGQRSTTTATPPTASSGTSSTPGTKTPPVVPASKPQPPADELAILASRGYESDSGNYFYVEGQVKNLTDKPLKSVAAVATWFDKDGTFITSDSALIEYDPLMPGQTSPFKTITRGNPRMSRFSVEFKHLIGGPIRSRDDSVKKK